MPRRRSDASSTRNQLPTLAPRGSQASSTATGSLSSASTSTSTTRPRLSHRSRAGCWTCRKRKVKCDEAHPKCGPCTRLNKDCDWEFRWKFDDVTSNTQNKYNNVSTIGNAVWDPQALRPSTSTRGSLSPAYDDLPSFADLTNNEDRERKAESRAPGTYNVIVNPQSFASLPEYGNSDAIRPQAHSTQSASSGRSANNSPNVPSEASRGRPRVVTQDPDTIVLSRFEDVSPSMPSVSTFPQDRRTSLPDAMQRMEITVSPRGSSLPCSRGEGSGPGGRNERLMVHYRGFITKRIMPLGKHFYLDFGAGYDDPIVGEGRNFPPLYHAICAVCLLSLALKGQQQLLPEAFQHYHQAISSSLTSPSDLNSDRLLYLHFLLLVYDICYATHGCNNSQDGFNMNMWVQHIHHLLRIAQNRKGQVNGVLQAYILWYVLYLDCQACLSGNGSGDFVRAYVEGEIILPDWKDLEDRGLMPMQLLYPNEDRNAFAAIYKFSNGVSFLGAKLSTLTTRLRADATIRGIHGLDPQFLAIRQHSILQLRNEFYAFWATEYPSFLSRDSMHAGATLPAIVRVTFESALLQFTTFAVYLNTCVYPGQQLHNSQEIRNEIAHRCTTILSMATAVVEAQNFDQHHIVFPVFLAGFATPDLDAKRHAINLMSAMEGTGISRNASRSRELLVAVCEEQRVRVMTGSPAEEVDWISLAKSRGLGVVNFGL